MPEALLCCMPSKGKIMEEKPMARFGRCANPGCGIVLNLDRFPQGQPCHKCGERRRVALPESEQPAGRPASGKRVLAIVIALTAAGVGVAIAAFLMLGPGARDRRPERTAAPPAVAEAIPPPAQVAATAQPEIAKPAAAEADPPPAPPVEETPPPEAVQRELTQFPAAVSTADFMYHYNPTRTETRVERYLGADLHLDPPTRSLTVTYPEAHERYEAPVYQIPGRSEIFLPPAGPLKTALLCDVVSGRVFEIPEGGFAEAADAMAVDREARRELHGATARPLVVLDVGFYHMLFALVSYDEAAPPLLVGFCYRGQRLPVRAPAE